MRSSESAWLATRSSVRSSSTATPSACTGAMRPCFLFWESRERRYVQSPPFPHVLLFPLLTVAFNATQNELSALELIHNLVETMDKYFENVCELDIMFNLEKAHFILDEMISDGYVMETNKSNILRPIRLLDRFQKKK